VYNIKEEATPMKNNAYFDEMYRIGHEWSLAHRAHEELKEQIIKEKGWDSDELKAWYEEEAFDYDLDDCDCYDFDDDAIFSVEDEGVEEITEE
jgi:hypothetical protein